MNKFRNEMNVLLTKGLFFENALADKSQVVYTLKDWDHESNGVVYPSLYRLYMETNDPTEYRFAVTHLDGWYHWEMLLECNWFKPYIERWRKELETRMKSLALSRIMAESKSSSKESFMANKYLLEKGWEPKESQANKRGRPSKEEIKRAAEDHFRTETHFQDDFDRLKAIKVN